MMSKRILKAIGITLALVAMVLTSLSVNVNTYYALAEESSDFVIENGVLKKYTGNGGEVVIPEGVRAIGNLAFYRKKKVTGITIPDSVTTIGDFAFNDCSKLTKIVIPSGVREIGKWAFSGCNSLTSIKIDADNTVYDSRKNCNAVIETSTNKLIAGCAKTVIPKDVTVIGNGAFINCSSLVGIEIPVGVTSIEDYAFSGCSSLVKIRIPEGVTKIGCYAFSDCNSLVKVYLPKSIKEIGGGNVREGKSSCL